MDIESAVALVTCVVTLVTSFFALREARRSEKRTAEAHEMLREAHRIGEARHIREIEEHRKQQLASSLVELAYLRAAKRGSAGVTGVALRANATEREREAALSLKGDPRVIDVTIEEGGTIRIWVDGSGFPSVQ